MRKRKAPEGWRAAIRFHVLQFLANQPGGKAPLYMIYRDVERSLGAHFGPREKADVPSGKQETWKNDVQQERRNMIARELLVNRNDGIWEIAEKGRQWAATHKTPPKVGFDLNDLEA